MTKAQWVRATRVLAVPALVLTLVVVTPLARSGGVAAPAWTPMSPVSVTFDEALVVTDEKSVDFIASTVNTVRVPSPFENVSFVDCRSTSTAGAGGAFFRST